MCDKQVFVFHEEGFNTLRLRQKGHHFADDLFKRIFLNENVWISIKISLRFVPKGPINNIPALVLIMAWNRPGHKPLSEPMMVSLLTHICVTQPQWLNYLGRPFQSWEIIGSVHIIFCFLKWIQQELLSFQSDEVNASEDNLQQELLRHHREYIQKSQQYDELYDKHSRISQVKKFWDKLAC